MTYSKKKTLQEKHTENVCQIKKMLWTFYYENDFFMLPSKTFCVDFLTENQQRIYHLVLMTLRLHRMSLCDARPLAFLFHSLFWQSYWPWLCLKSPILYLSVSDSWFASQLIEISLRKLIKRVQSICLYPNNLNTLGKKLFHAWF